MRHALLLVLAMVLASCEYSPDPPSDSSPVVGNADAGADDVSRNRLDPSFFYYTPPAGTEETDQYDQWSADVDDRWDTDPYDALNRDQIGYARDQIRWERDNLRRSVRGLQYGDWENDLPRVERDLRNLDNAVWDLELEDPSNPATQDLRYEVDRMKRDVRRLDSEDWRNVVPDLDRASRNIDYSTEALDSFDDDWE